MLTLAGCTKRQLRLQQQLEARKCDVFITGDNRAVYYLTGSFNPDGSPTIFAMWQDGATVLVRPSKLRPWPVRYAMSKHIPSCVQSLSPGMTLSGCSLTSITL